MNDRPKNPSKIPPGPYIRQCPKCDKQLKYANIYSFRNADKLNGLCLSCGARAANPPAKGPFIRSCPKCDKDLEYANVVNFNKAEKEGWICPSCSARNRPPNPKSVGPFIRTCPQCCRNVEYARKNALIAALKLNSICFECRKSNMTKFVGPANPRYGKPAPKYGRFGWAGWFHGHHFRSLLELNYMIRLFEDDKEWVTGEILHIPYVDEDAVARNYSLDFIVGNEIIECKPRRQQTLPRVLKKNAAARHWAELYSMIFQIVDPGRPSWGIIKRLIASGELDFSEDTWKKASRQIERPALVI